MYTKIYICHYLYRMLKQWVKFVFHFFLICLVICCFIWNQLILYGISQGLGQISLILQSQPVAKVLDDPAFPDSLKLKLRLVEEVKRYTVDSLGLNPSKNYTTVYNQHGKPILFTITACEPYAFKPKEWTFPLLGTVSYKGFFNLEKARKEYESLILAGYDVDMYSPSGWSTLGWFQDPILSNMLQRSNGTLINLIIHELSHGTIYVKNNVNFNENLANFVADKGTEEFIKDRFGVHSKQFQDYEYKKEDEKRFSDYMLRSTKSLDSLYDSFSNEPDTVKRHQKNQLVMKIVLGVNRLHLHKPKNYFRYALQAFSEGNAFFMSFMRYDSQYEIFEKEYREKFHSNLRNYILYLKKTYPSL
jgi:predicted aminopeptidase